MLKLCQIVGPVEDKVDGTQRYVRPLCEYLRDLNVFAEKII